MIFLWRKNGNDKTGELIIVLTEQDRAHRLVAGPQWQCINDAINAFNKDPDVKNIYVTAAYAGDLKDEILDKYLTEMNNRQAREIRDAIQNNKVKVRPDGSSVEDDNEDSSSNIKHSKTIAEALSEFDLDCPECHGKGTALVDKDGNIYPCKSCLLIDAYQDGKKKGLSQGFETGQAAAMGWMDKQLTEIQKEKENDNETNGTENRSSRRKSK